MTKGTIDSYWREGIRQHTTNVEHSVTDNMLLEQLEISAPMIDTSSIYGFPLQFQCPLVFRQPHKRHHPQTITWTSNSREWAL